MRIRTLFLLTIASMCMIGCRDESAQQPVVPPPAPADAATVSNFGNSRHQFGEFSFAIPDGWAVVKPERNKTKAMLLLNGTNWQDAKAMIKVDVGTPAAPSAEELAQQFVTDFGGTVSQEPVEFDGTAGVKVSTSSTTLATPRNAIVIFRDNQVYLLMAGAVEGVELTSAIDTIQKSWTWTK